MIVRRCQWFKEVDMEGIEAGQLGLEVAGLDMFVFIDFYSLAWHTVHVLTNFLISWPIPGQRSYVQNISTDHGPWTPFLLR